MSTLSVQEIERAIEALPIQQREELLTWVDQQYASAVDESLARAIENGEFDVDIEQALEDERNGKTRLL